MARVKQRAPLQREPSDLAPGVPDPSDTAWKADGSSAKANGEASLEEKATEKKVKAALTKVSEQQTQQQQSGFVQLIVCVGGIYASFLTWAYLQERITTTVYTSTEVGRETERWTYAIVLNTIQSALAALTGLLYLYLSRPRDKRMPSPIPSREALGPLLLVAVTASLASPFGYAALAHIDYLTFILAKACKLLPVMFLHLTVFRRRHPPYKYLVVILVTAGVALFTLQHPHHNSKTASSRSSAPKTPTSSSAWGLTLLAINLLFDGLTNSTQDHIFATLRPYSGPQMMAAQNLLSTLLTTAYLLFLPLVPGQWLQLFAVPATAPTELSAAWGFLQRHPRAAWDVLAFAACGAGGQVFIYATLARFSSLVLVTVTVTRKMLTMLLSVLAFGHTLSPGQWAGVALVFGGVAGEAAMARRDKKRKESAAKAAGEKKSK